MKDILNKLSVHIALWISIVFLAICTSFSFVYYFSDESTMAIKGNMFLQIVGIIGLLSVVLLLNRVVSALYAKHKIYEWIHLVITICLVGVVAFGVINGMRQSPNSDALAVYNIAKSFSSGNYEAYTSKDSYLALFPFQTSFVFLMEWFIRITGKSGYIVFQYLNVIYYVMIILSGYGILKSQERSRYALFPYLFMISSCAPIFLYMPNIYGDIPHLALMSLALWMLCLGKSAIHYGRKLGIYTMGIISAVLAMMYKENVWIFIVAYILCITVDLLRQWSWENVVVVLILIVAVYCIPNMVDTIYQNKTGRECGNGIPTLAVIAMGMQENNGVCGGWNGFHSDTFQQTGYDYDATLEISKMAVLDRLEYFREHPKYFLEFYKNKVIFQWAEAEYTSFYPLKISAERTRAEWTESVLFGAAKEKILIYMDIYQSVIYLMALVFVGFETIFFVKKKSVIQCGSMVILVTFIGGFLFSLIWEAGGRMALPYFVLLIPVASQGIGYIYDMILTKEHICCRS